MSEINRELPPGALTEESAGRSEPLDISLVEYYLGASRKGVQVTIDSTHLAQLCNEVWRYRRQAHEARAAGVSLEAENQERANRLAETATKAIANVGHSANTPIHEATAIVMVANLLAEGIKRRRDREDQDAVMLKGGTVSGSAAAIEYVKAAIAELMEWRRGARRPDDEGARNFGDGHVLHGRMEAIAAVASRLDELERLRAEHEAARDLGGIGTVHGTPEAIDVLNKLLNELESAQRIIAELERMGWLMKAKAP